MAQGTRPRLFAVSRMMLLLSQHNPKMLKCMLGKRDMLFVWGKTNESISKGYRVLKGARRELPEMGQLWWDDSQKEGRWVHTLISRIELNQNRHGKTNYYLTQFLSGHGGYSQYLQFVLVWLCVFLRFPLPQIEKTTLWGSRFRPNRAFEHRFRLSSTSLSI